MTTELRIEVTQDYRGNALEETKRREFKAAQATLEGMADDMLIKLMGYDDESEMMRKVKLAGVLDPLSILEK